MSKEMMVFRFDEYVDAPIDVVFELVNDDEKIKLWNTLLVENIYENDEDKYDYKPGMKFKTVQRVEKKTVTVDSEMIEYDPPYKIIMHSTSKEGLSISKYFLTREGTGTRIVVESSVIPSNFFYKLTIKLFGWAVKAMYIEQYKNLVNYIENEVADY